MHNIFLNMCEKFHDDQWRNDGALGDRNSDDNNNIMTALMIYVMRMMMMMMTIIMQ